MSVMRKKVRITSMEGRVGDLEEASLESCCSDSEYLIDGATSEKFSGLSGDGMLQLKDKDEGYISLKHRFYVSTGSLMRHCNVAAAYKSLHSSPLGKARLGAFRMFLKAMEEKRGGDANVKHGWSGTRKGEAIKIMSEGYNLRGMPQDGGLFDAGVKLNSESSAADSVLSSPVDEDGLRHLVVCLVMLRSTEVVAPGSRQLGPSSGKFDSGVDNEHSPTRYIVWYPNVNMHILPMYALNVKLNFNSRGLQRTAIDRPNSPWMPVSALITVLSKSLPLPTLCMVKKFHNYHLERKITRRQLLCHVRQLIGDRPLISAIEKLNFPR